MSAATPKYSAKQNSGRNQDSVHLCACFEHRLHAKLVTSNAYVLRHAELVRADRLAAT